ncbi:uncharacterized protein LOC133744549 [Rosa rugosa]|uniref:uncharacterized protein LOC133744549 n=1 Tax=Rosa rugosa TaxID=74645 RepID=UPI002B40C779|nr:uncharacterized protein LOC133744549 [Rosa rugosa]
MTGLPSIPGIERSLFAYTTNDIFRVKLCACFERITAQATEMRIPTTVRKSLELELHEEPVENVSPINEKKLDATAKAEQNGPILVDLEKQKAEVQPQTIGKECQLASGSIDNVVAIATIIEVNDESNSQLIHDEGNKCVSIVRSLVDEAKLPFPI